MNLIPNERNVNKILIETTVNSNMYKKINTNMNYHMRYNKLNYKAIKYYQKRRSVPIETF